MFVASLAYLTDLELDRMRSRAYGRAARAWQEARAAGLDNATRLVLTASAESEEHFWRELQLETLRRVDAERALMECG